MIEDLDEPIEIPEKSQKFLMEAARVAGESAQRQNLAIAATMAALGVPDGWQISRDASLFEPPHS